MFMRLKQGCFYRFLRFGERLGAGFEASGGLALASRLPASSKLIPLIRRSIAFGISFCFTLAQFTPFLPASKAQKKKPKNSLHQFPKMQLPGKLRDWNRF